MVHGFPFASTYPTPPRHCITSPQKIVTSKNPTTSRRPNKKSHSRKSFNRPNTFPRKTNPPAYHSKHSKKWYGTEKALYLKWMLSLQSFHRKPSGTALVTILEFRSWKNSTTTSTSQSLKSQTPHETMWDCLPHTTTLRFTPSARPAR